jgi:hypothetical protein
MDADGRAMSFTWAIISQPLGSSVSLSSTTGTTVSFTPTTNGAYAFAATPNDGVLTGVPAVFSVSVSGGSSPPPPALGPTNGFVTLQSDHPTYTVGQHANFNLNINTQVGNQDYRYYFSATYDGQAITLSNPNQNFNYATANFTAMGTHTFQVVQSVEQTDIAQDIINSISLANSDIAAATASLQYETNQSVIAQLQARISADEQQIATYQQAQANNRTTIGNPVVVTITVN